MIPTILGFPLWKGRIKPRVAKKYLRRWRHEWFLKAGPLAKLTIGDSVNDCSGQNGQILSMKPRYYGVRGGQVLGDVDITTENTGCSLVSCGIEPALAPEVIEARMVDHMVHWTLADSGKLWFGSQWDTMAAHANRVLQHINAGGHIVNANGRILPEWRAP